MRRRGGRVVSTGSTSINTAPEAGASNPAGVGIGAKQPSSPLATAPFSPPNVAPVTIPTLDIFGKFQRHRDDFEADWMLLQDDAEPSTASPIAAKVVEKLRRHQAQLNVSRAVAAAERSKHAKTAAVAPNHGPAVTKSESAVKGDEAFEKTSSLSNGAAVAAATMRRQGRGSTKRQPHLYDSAEDESQGSSSGMPATAPTAELAQLLGDDEDYTPEDRNAVQYHRKASTTTRAAAPPQKATSKSPTSTVVADSAAVAEAPREEVEEGFTEDYLNFQNVPADGSKSLSSSALQATVQVSRSAGEGPGSPTASVPEGRSRAELNNMRKRGRGGESASDVSSRSPPKQTMVVPLWSIERMEKYGGYCTSCPLVALHQEVTDLVEYLRPTIAEVLIRRYIEQEVSKVAKRLWPQCKPVVYGSMYTQLLLPLSDLDMTILDVSASPEEALTELAREINNAGLCENAYPQLILKTKVPLIKFIHRGSLVDVDISIGASDGKNNSDVVLQCLKRYPEAQPLTVLIKYFLSQRGMHEPYHGGMGSYAATLLVVGFLKEHPIYTTHPEQRPFTGLGRLLIDFFRLIGQYWNTMRVGLRVEGIAATATAGGDWCTPGAMVGFFPRDDAMRGGHDGPSSPLSPSSPLRHGGPMGPPQAFIEDPVDPRNNAASSLRNFHSISSMLTYAYLALTSPIASTLTETERLSCTPDAPLMSQRPTLLSRVFHVDAEMVYHRQATEATYQQLCREMPAYMEQLRHRYQAEDAGMIDPALAYASRKNAVVSLEERIALGRLADLSARAAAGKLSRNEKERVEGKVQAGQATDAPRVVVKADRGSSEESNASSVRMEVRH